MKYARLAAAIFEGLAGIGALYFFLSIAGAFHTVGVL